MMKMRRWDWSLDISTIPDEVFIEEMKRRADPDGAVYAEMSRLVYSEMGRRRSLARTVFSGGLIGGGRKPTCHCGTCGKCVRRAADRAKRDAGIITRKRTARRS